MKTIILLLGMLLFSPNSMAGKITIAGWPPETADFVSVSSILNSWVEQSGGAADDLKFRWINSNVEIKGNMNAASATLAHLFTLPSTHWPVDQVTVPITHKANITNGGETDLRLVIDTDGKVSIYNNTAIPATGNIKINVLISVK